MGKAVVSTTDRRRRAAGDRRARHRHRRRAGAFAAGGRPADSRRRGARRRIESAARRSSSSATTGRRSPRISRTRWRASPDGDTRLFPVSHADNAAVPSLRREHLTMNVSVFGLGYVGSVSAASFAADGHTVVGVDVNPDKVASLNDGRSPIVETGLDELIRDNAAERTAARDDRAPTEAVDATDLSLICVGTPSRKNGSLDLTYLERVCEQIGEALERQGRLPRRRRPQHGAAGHDARRRDPGARADVGQEVRRRLRRRGEPGVPARGHGDQGLPQSAADAGRPQLHVATRSRPRRSTARSTRRWSAPASASPR